MDVGLVCDACSALTPIGVPQCARCGQPVALDPRQKRSSVQPPSGTPQAGANGTASPPALTNPGTAVGSACGKCGSMIPPNFKFCPSCGNKVSPSAARGQQDFEVQTRVGPRTDPSAQKPGRSTLFFGGAMQAARAKLTLIRGDGEDGVSFTLAGTDHLAGRGDCPISFPDDTFLSPTHANFRYANNQLVVRDEGSLNGLFVRISGTVQITAGTTILVGEQVLTITPAAVADDVPDAEGTYYSASMIRHATIEIAQQLRGGTPGWVFRVDTEAVSIGRENNDINFPDDPFISGRHAQIQLVQGMLSVTDLGSRNGTFVRVSGEHVLKHGDYVFLGQQLLRVEIV
jgi:pSer/pThr/pTyr-binding forkhead associated (FHA) protein/RNA polymerase subunit RPABC4/transcription elongation factor Spt4